MVARSSIATGRRSSEALNAAWLKMRGENLAAGLSSIAAFGYDIFTVEERRSASWRPKDLAGLCRLAPPFSPSSENLLLLPAERRSPRGAEASGQAA